MQEVINGDYLAASLTLITLRKRLRDIREVMKDLWDENEKNTVNIPEWQRPIKDTFDFRLSQYIQMIKDKGKFYEVANWAGHQLNQKRLLELKPPNA